MSSKVERCYNFMKTEKSQGFMAFILYIIFIVVLTNIHLPLILQCICSIVSMFALVFIIPIYITIWWFDEKVEKNQEENIFQKIKKITKEFAMFLPFLFISTYIISLILTGEAANETRINESFGEAVILNTILIIFIGPILEEFIFRLLPYKFIKKKLIYHYFCTRIRRNACS